MNERRDLITIMFGRGVQILTSLVSIRLLTSLLSTEEVGRIFILGSLTSFFALLLINPIGMYINRKTHDWYRNKTMQRNLYLFWLYLLAVILFAVFFLLLLKNTVGVGIEITWVWVLLVVIGHLLFNTANVTIITILNMLGRRIWFVAFTLLTIWVGLGAAFLFIITMSATAEYWVLGLVLGQAVIFFASYWYLTRRCLKNQLPAYEPLSVFANSIFKINSRMLNYLSDMTQSEPLITLRGNMISTVFHFAWPVAIAASLWWVHTQSYRFVLGHLGGLGALGLFAIGYGIAAKIMAVFESIFTQYYHPVFYKEISTADTEGKRISWNKFAAYLFPGALLMVVFIIACAPFLTKLLVAAEFQESARFILWGALAELARVLGSGFSMIAHAQMKTGWLILPAITGATLALGGVFLLSQWDPQTGTGIALVIAGFAMALHLACKLHRKIAFNLPWRRIFISIALSAPLLVGLLGFDTLNDHLTYARSFIVLALAGIYLLIAQYLMATHWLGSAEIKEVAP